MLYDVSWLEMVHVQVDEDNKKEAIKRAKQKRENEEEDVSFSQTSTAEAIEAT